MNKEQKGFIVYGDTKSLADELSDEMLRYKDRRFRISKIVRVIPVNKLPGCRGCYYELEGCVSPKGIPYGITSDWVQKITEVRR